MTKTNKITKNYFYNLAYQLFIMLVPIITAPYLARVLGPDKQGIASYVCSVSSIISTITMLGIFSYGNRQIAYERDNKEKMSQTFWEIMIIRIIMALIGSVVYFAVSFEMKEFRKYFYCYYLWLLAGYIDCTWVYVGLEDMKPAVVKNFFAKVFTVLGIFLFVKEQNDLKKYIFILSLSVLIANISAYTQLKKYILKPVFNINKLFFHVKGAFHLFLPYVATLIYLQVDKIMIGLITQMPSQISYYENAEKIVTIPLTFITVLSTVMMPRIANEYSKSNFNMVKKYLTKATEISLFLAFPMCLGIMMISSKFIPWYLGKDYTPVILAIIILAPIIISNSLEGIAGKQYFTATNQIKILMISYISTAIINIIINIALIPYYGFVGAAIATLISSYLCIIIQYYYLTKQIKMRGIFTLSIKYGLYSLVMAIISYMITKNLNPGIFTTSIQIFIGFTTYGIICLILKDKNLIQIIGKFNLT